MPNQRELAAKLGLAQSTVSMALRGSPLISPEVRKRVLDAAKETGYRPNAYVSALMGRIQSGKKMNDKGVIALLTAARSQKEWYSIESYRLFHQGVVKRGAELGYRIESFFLQQPGMGAETIDRILQARGITGLIFAPPYHGNREVSLSWDHYTAVGVGFGWEEQELSRVTYDSLQNYITAFLHLRQLGYRRIGTSLSNAFTHGTRMGTKWYTGYLDCQSGIPKRDRIPLFTGSTPYPGEVLTEAAREKLPEEFRAWVLKWKPDTVLSLVGHERIWLDPLNLKIPDDIGLACLALPPGSDCAGIDEESHVVGATAVELVAAQIAHNEFGLPSHPKTTMIEGRWIHNNSVRNQN